MPTLHFDIGHVRRQFPALALEVGGYPAAFLDSPGGTQTPQRVMLAMVDYLVHSNANTHGFFETSVTSDHLLADARDALADFLGCDWDEVSFGHNMTTTTFLLAHSLARDWAEGDEVVITELDHEANRGPWLSLRERGIVVREVPVDPATCTLDWEAFEELVNERTKLVAIGYASNAVGTVNDVKRAVALAGAVGALTVVDAVHYALHGVIDCHDLGCDFLLCSAYKFFAPHVGVLFARRDAAARVPALKLRTVSSEPPFRFETGTLNHEGIAGAAEAVEFIAEMGAHHEEFVAGLEATDASVAARMAGLEDRRRDVVAGMLAAEAYAQPLAQYLREELRAIGGVTVYGPPDGHPRTATVSFTINGVTAEQACRRLGERGLFLWDGDFYALRLVEVLGLVESGGLIRAGVAPYNTRGEIERVLETVGELARRV
jgi:cysteine desulfurase family protein (TIGR01976 family)